MITRDTIDKIIDAARIEDVVGDFVNLKKRGVNLLGLCPFHNEKTPSFNVNPVRNIFKCFGCGKGGNAVNFVMEHEHFTYPEALKYLARKYHIDVEETLPSPEEQVLQDDKESMLVLNTFAQKTFSQWLTDSEEGKSVALPYFKERGFNHHTIEKFELGYTPEDRTAFTDFAQKQGYQMKYLQSTGLSTSSDDGKKPLDRFRGRILFPIHSLAGRVLGFGGRIMKKDEKAAKYLNSPESEVYHKSKVLYGLYFAKKAIVQQDNCFLVEGYTDVISMHQAGIENVVASSGTSLTVEQIRLIKRYTNNITILYDGDAAGIKASLRGTDMILEEGMNVKLVSFPHGDDPDSYARKHNVGEMHEFIQQNAVDFVVFKTNLLLGDAGNDPVRKAQVVRDVVETISKIPDAIIRAFYVKQVSTMMDVGEQMLINETNKLRNKSVRKEAEDDQITELLPELIRDDNRITPLDSSYQEKELVRLLLFYHSANLRFVNEEESKEFPGRMETIESIQSLLDFIITSLQEDEIEMAETSCKKVYHEMISFYEKKQMPMEQYFIHHHDPDISKLTVELMSNKYILSPNWDLIHHIDVPEEKDNLTDSATKAVFHLKNKKVMQLIDKTQQQIKTAHEKGDDYDELIRTQIRLDDLKKYISKMLGIDVLR